MKALEATITLIRAYKYVLSFTGQIKYDGN